MKPKKAIKELRKQLRDDPANVVLKIRLASLLRDIGSHPEAVEQYLEVAQAYDLSGRIGQALAVCKGVLEFAPRHQQAQQINAYLENKRHEAEGPPPATATLSPLPEHNQAGREAISEADDSRRKRPTSMPTPLSDRGSESSLPGLRTGASGRIGHRSGDSLVLNTRRPIPDNTVPGAPPVHPSTRVGDSQRLPGVEDSQRLTGRLKDSQRISEQGFRLQDLKQAAQTLTPAGPADPDSGMHTLERLPPKPRMQLPSTETPKPSEAQPTRQLPLSPGRRPDVIATKQFARGLEATPPTLAPAPTITPPPTPTPPQESSSEDGPALEDATIVDASFDLVAYMAAEQEAKEEDLPDLPSVASAPAAPAAPAAPTAVAVPSELGPLQGLPRYALDALMESANVQVYPEGVMVVREGEPLDACRVVQSGSMKILKCDPVVSGDALVNYGTVGPGALLGASAFSAESSSVALGAGLAVGELHVMEIPLSAIEELRARFPAAGPTLELFYRDRCCDMLMSSSPIFASLDEHDRAELVGMFEPVRAGAGQSIVQAGGHVGGFYLVLSGELEVESRLGAHFNLLPGGFVGDVGVLQGKPSAVSIRATRSTELGRLDAQRFYELISRHPQVWAEIWQQSARPELDGMQLVAGAAANV